MSVTEGENSLLDMDVSADDYAKIAATDQPADVVAATANSKQDRTYQSEEDFKREKEGYEAKIEDGDIWKQLSSFTPPFNRPSSSSPSNTTDTSEARSTMTRKDFILVTAAVGELYWSADYATILAICDWADRGFALDGKMSESVKRWREKSESRMKG